jgi:cytochrome b561
MLVNTEQQYGLISKLLHWGSALLVIGLIAVGFYMEGLADEDPSKGSIYFAHKAAGTAVLVILVLRIVWLRISKAPAVPSAFNAKEKGIMTGIKHSLYLLMLLVPVSGITMSLFFGSPVPFLGLIEIPGLEKNMAIAGFAHSAHGILAWIITALVVLHAVAAFKHRLLERGTERDVLSRML